MGKTVEVFYCGLCKGQSSREETPVDEERQVFCCPICGVDSYLTGLFQTKPIYKWEGR